MDISTLQSPVKAANLQSSRWLYDQLPCEHDQPEPSTEHLQNVARIIAANHAQEAFMIHLLHRHGSSLGRDQLPVTFRAPHDLDTPAIYQKRRVTVTDNGPDRYGRVWALTEDHDSVACEMQDWPPVLPKHVDILTLLEELAAYLMKHALQWVLGLQVVDNEVKDALVELETDGGGTITFRKDGIGNYPDGRVTNWSVQYTNGLVSLTPQETHAIKEGETKHSRFIPKPKKRVLA